MSYQSRKKKYSTQFSRSAICQKMIAAAQQYMLDSEKSWSDWRMDLAAVELDRLGQVKRLRILENAVEE